MRYEPIDKELFIGNRRKLAGMLPPRSIAIIQANDEMLRTGDQHFTFRQNSDLFYLTGLDQEKCLLLLCPDFPDETLREVVFTIRADETMITWTGHKLTIDQIREISGVNTVKWIDDLPLTLRELILHSDHVYMNQNEYVKLITEVPSRDLRFVRELKECYPLHQFHRLAPLITGLRFIKEPEEIALIRIACELTEKAFGRVLKFVKPGIMEYEIEAEMTHEFIRSGANGHAYQPIIGSGKNAMILHYIANSDICHDGDLLLMDFGAEYANYVSDCTRTIPVNGKFTERQRQCYEAVLRVMKKATGLYVPGNTIDKVNKEVHRMMQEEMVELGLFTQEDIKKQDLAKPRYTKYLMHGVCHPIGLDVHDVGGKYVPFQKGMVLTLEPGIYIPEENIGIRIENDILVDDVPVDLMSDIPREVKEIEGMMDIGSQ